MLKNWSRDSSLPEFQFNPKITVSRKCWEVAHYSLVNGMAPTRELIDGSYLVCKAENKSFVKSYLKMLKDDKPFTFDELVEHLHKVHQVRLNADWEMKSSCSCKWFSKQYLLYTVCVFT